MPFKYRIRSRYINNDSATLSTGLGIRLIPTLTLALSLTAIRSLLKYTEWLRNVTDNATKRINVWKKVVLETACLAHILRL